MIRQKGNGYKTGYVGKWHLSGEEKPGFASEETFGYNDVKYMWNRGHFKFFDEDEEGNVIPHDFEHKDKFKGQKDTAYATDFLFKKGIKFMNKKITITIRFCPCL